MVVLDSDTLLMTKQRRCDDNDNSDNHDSNDDEN